MVENARIRGAMEESGAHDVLMLLVDQVIRQIMEYHKYGFRILGIMGADRSPSCGVETTSNHDQEIVGKGIFMQELHSRLVREEIKVPMLGIKSSDDVLKKVGKLL